MFSGISKVSVDTAKKTENNMQLILSFALIILGIIILVLLAWYYYLYRAAKFLLFSAVLPGPFKTEVPETVHQDTINLGISTGLFYEKDILEVLPLISKAGYRFVEIWAGPQKWGEYTHFNWHKEYRVHSLSVCLKILGLKVSSLHAPFSDAIDISSPSELRRRFAVTEVLRTLEVLKKLGGEYLVIHPASNENSLKNRDIHFKQSRKSIEEIALCVQDMGLKLAVENQLPHILGGDVSTVLELIEGLPAANVGICFDTSHANLYYGQSIETSFQQLSDRIMTFHLSDNYGRHDDHFILGDGHINWNSFNKMLKIKDYSGVLMLEVLAEVNRGDKVNVLKTGYDRAKQFLMPDLKAG